MRYGWDVSIDHVLSLWRLVLGRDIGQETAQFLLGSGHVDPKPLHQLCAAKNLVVPEGLEFCLFGHVYYKDWKVELRDHQDKIYWVLCVGSWRDDAEEGSVRRAMDQRRLHAGFFFRLLYMLEVGQVGSSCIRWSPTRVWRKKADGPRRPVAADREPLTSACVEARCPDVVLLCILAKVPPRHLPAAGLVCRRWNRLFLHESVVAALLYPPRFAPW